MDDAVIGSIGALAVAWTGSRTDPVRIGCHCRVDHNAMGVGSSDLACAAMVGIPAGVRSGDGLAGGLDPPDAAATACVGVGASAVGGNRGGQAA